MEYLWNTYGIPIEYLQNTILQANISRTFQHHIQDFPDFRLYIPMESKVANGIFPC